MAREPVKSSDLNDRLGVLERVNEACPPVLLGVRAARFYVGTV